MFFDELVNRKFKTNRIKSIVLRATIIVLGLTEYIIMCITYPIEKLKLSIGYFTIQSNFWIIIVALFFLIVNIIELKQKKEIVGKKLKIVKFIFTVSITLTFFIYNIGNIATNVPFSFWSYHNIVFHYINPALFALDYFIFDNDMKVRFVDCFLSLIPPFYYFGFSFIRAEVGSEFIVKDYRSRFAYFFMDVDKYGWFGNENGVGVIFYVFLVVGMVFTIALIYYGINKLKFMFYHDKIELAIERLELPSNKIDIGLSTEFNEDFDEGN